MSTTLAEPLPEVATPLSTETLADLVHRLGDVPLSRIRLHPAPGTATEDDAASAEKPWCELVDGVLVERPMGYFEGRLAFILGVFLEEWLRSNPIGYANADGALTRLTHGNVRVPDASFVRWERTRDHRVPRDPICGIAPNLAVEVLSPSNTHREIERKRQEYFDAGVELVWIVEPELMTVEVWSSAKECRILDRNDTLDGGTVLPGFQLSIQTWFDRAQGNAPALPTP
ncbi:MAG TPA: Uma2 family endonuclease [Planctomycetaceae bacterium]|nr:Uma2 family endonuclease [Planctomycetaceae bacterium]